MNRYFFAIIAMAAVGLVLLQFRHRRDRRRQQAVAQVLDAADALEARLRDARMEIESITDSQEDPVRQALQEMLRQRLWLKEHGKQATVAQLHSVRDAIQAARAQVEQQLDRIDRARLPTSR